MNKRNVEVVGRRIGFMEPNGSTWTKLEAKRHQKGAQISQTKKWVEKDGQKAINKNKIMFRQRRFQDT